MILSLQFTYTTTQNVILTFEFTRPESAHEPQADAAYSVEESVDAVLVRARSG